MKPSIKIIALFMGLFSFSCSPDTTDESTQATKTSASPLSYKVIDPSIVWDFNDITGWKDASQVGLQNYWIEDGNLTISPIQTLGKEPKSKLFQLLQKALTPEVVCF
jgi:hypothetical protein